MDRHTVTVFGGSGFIGRHLVRILAAERTIVRVAVRDPEAAHFLKPMGDVGQIVPFGADITDAELVRAAVAGAGAVVNLVGILSQRGRRGRRTFQRIHVEGAANVAEAAKVAGVPRLVHVSALGADARSSSEYARTKAAGEVAVRAAFPEATILRPSVIFGPEDRFFNMFATIARLAPALPVFGCPNIPRVTCFGEDGLVKIAAYGDGGTRFQPVYVGDVAKAISKAVAEPATRGHTYTLGGPRVYSYKEVMELVLGEIGRRRLLVPIPFEVAAIPAWFLEKWPRPLLTRDQVRLLKQDNVVGEGAFTFTELGIAPTAAEAILPTYLRRFRPHRMRASAA